jgi:hypothetical protein
MSPQTFKQARLVLPQVDIPVPNDVEGYIGDGSNIRSIAATFFRTIHTWMPIICKKEFFTHLLNPLAGRKTELSLLALCMHLSSASSTSLDIDLARLYHTAKRFHSEVKRSGTLSIYVLQAGILIGLYELGQAIYPAAYFTVGECARYGVALGIDKLKNNPVEGDVKLRGAVHTEESRRVWWSVLMLDRSV